MNRIESPFCAVALPTFLRLTKGAGAVLALLLAPHWAHAQEARSANAGEANGSAKADVAPDAGVTAEAALTGEASAPTEPSVTANAAMTAEAQDSAAPAAPAPAAPAPAAPGAATATAITLKITLGDSTLSADAVEQAIETELSATLDRTDVSADLELTLGGGRVVARAKGTDGRVIERSMTLPASEEDQLQVIALLSENLLRDEASAVLSQLPDPAAKKKDEGPFWPVGVSVTRNLGLPGKDATVAFALSVPDGQWKSLRGLGVSAISLSFTARSTGLAVAGIFHEAASFDGVSIGGIYDGTTDLLGSRRGVSIGGIYSRGAGDVTGIQIGGLMSGAGRTMTGIQIGGLVSSAAGTLAGLQIGAFNHAGAAKHGLQIGVVNFAEQGGAQIGVVNVRKKGDGPQIGVLGFGPETKLQLASWVQGFNLEPLEGGMPVGPTANVGLRVQTKYTVSMVHLGVGVETNGCGPQNDCGTGKALLIPGYTVGGRLPVSKVWSFELDLQHRIPVAQSPYSPDTLAFRGSVVARVHPLVALFVAAGPELVFPTVSELWVREQVALGVQVL